MVFWTEAVPIPLEFNQNSCDTRIVLDVRNSSFIANEGLREDGKHILSDK